MHDFFIHFLKIKLIAKHQTTAAKYIRAKKYFCCTRCRCCVVRSASQPESCGFDSLFSHWLHVQIENQSEWTSIIFSTWLWAISLWFSKLNFHKDDSMGWFALKELEKAKARSCACCMCIRDICINSRLKQAKLIFQDQTTEKKQQWLVWAAEQC